MVRLFQGTYPPHVFDPSGTPGPIELPRVFSLKHEFPNEWYAYTVGAASCFPMTIQLSHKHFPAFCKRHNIIITGFYFATRLKDTTTRDFTIDVNGLPGELGILADTVGTTANPATLGSSLPPIDVTLAPELTLNFRFEIDSELFNLDTRLDDIYLIAIYEIAAAMTGTDEYEGIVCGSGGSTPVFRTGTSISKTE